MPTRTCCRRSPRRSARNPTPEIKGCCTLTQASIQLGSTDKATRLAALARARREQSRQHQDAAARRARKEGRRSTSSPTPTCAPRPKRSLHSVQSRLATGEMVGRVFSGLSLGSILLLAALGPRDHLRPDGRHQHGARRADHDRRLRDVRRAEPVSRSTRRRFRFLSRRAIPVAFAASRRRRHVARAHRDPLPLRPAAGDAARDVGHQPDPDADGTHDFRRAERPGRESVVDVRRHRGDHRRRAAVEPHRDHRLRRHGADADLAAADANAARPVRARGDAEPRDGELHSACPPAASTCWRSAWARASPGSPAARCRRSATSARISARATSSTRSWWSCWAAWDSSREPCTRRWASASSTSSSRPGRARCSPRSRCWCSSSSSSRSGRKGCSPSRAGRSEA